MNFKTSKNRQRNIRIIDVNTSICFMLILALFASFSIAAQDTPEPPTPPKTELKSKTSYSISVDDDSNETHNSSVSISVSDDSYKFRASYHDSKNTGVKALLLNKLGEKYLTKRGDIYLWANEEIFECKLSNGSLRIHVDREIASEAFLQKIKTLGNELKYFISGTSKKDEEAKTAERAKRELEHAEREVARAKRELAKAEREAKRAAKY